MLIICQKKENTHNYLHGQVDEAERNGTSKICGDFRIYFWSFVSICCV